MNDLKRAVLKNYFQITFWKIWNGELLESDLLKKVIPRMSKIWTFQNIIFYFAIFRRTSQMRKATSSILHAYIYMLLQAARWKAHLKKWTVSEVSTFGNKTESFFVVCCLVLILVLCSCPLLQGVGVTFYLTMIQTTDRNPRFRSYSLHFMTELLTFISMWDSKICPPLSL